GSAAALTGGWPPPDAAGAAGDAGRRFVNANYRSADDYTRRIVGAVSDLNTHLPAVMRKRGLARAAGLTYDSWQSRWGEWLTNQMKQPRERPRHCLRVRPVQREY